METLPCILEKRNESSGCQSGKKAVQGAYKGVSVVVLLSIAFRYGV